MSTTLTAPTAGPDRAPGAGSTGGAGPDDATGRGRPGRGEGGRRSIRRWRAPAIWAVVAVLVVLAVSRLALGSASSRDPLDPDSTRDDGTRALRSVLQDRGVDVEVVRSQATFLAATTGPDTTVLITTPDALSDATAHRAATHLASAAGVVLLEPGTQVLHGLDLPLQAAPGASVEQVSSGCSDADAARAGRISGGETLYAPVQSPPGTTVCFRPGATDPGGYEVILPRSASRPPVTVVGSSDVFTNRHISEAGNAALSLGILGDTTHLLWYVPTVADIPPGDQSSLATALPPWLKPAQLLGWSALLALMLWRGRRFGRLVNEPLPVVIKAVETTQSRGRMYRKAADRPRALAVLQAGARTRLARYLGLPVPSDPHSVAAVVVAVSSAAGRTIREVDSLLISAVAYDDATLLALAGHLAALEKDVRRS